MTLTIKTILGSRSMQNNSWNPIVFSAFVRTRTQACARATPRHTRRRLIDRNRFNAEIPHLRRYARALVRERESADDLVQDTLEKAWRKRALWRPTGRLRAWLFRILYRLYLDRRPRMQRAHRNLVALDDARPAAAPVAGADTVMHCRDVLAAIDALPERPRAILLLMAVEQPSYSAGARMLGIKEGTFRSRLSRARALLAQELQDGAQTPIQAEDAHG